MSLICSLGWHSPGALARFNDGYYFTRCSRCGCDLVRPIDGNWRVPKGYRVVWRASDGGRADAPLPKAIQAAPAAAAPEPELSEEIVADDAAVEEAVAEEAAEAAEAAEPGEAEEGEDVETIEPNLEASAHTIETIEPDTEAGDISQSEEPLVLTEEPAAEADEIVAETEYVEDLEEVEDTEEVEEAEDAEEAENVEEPIAEVEESETVEAAAVDEFPAEVEEPVESLAETGAGPERAEEAAAAEEDEAEEYAEESAPAAGDSAGKLPIEAVLAHLRENPEPASPAAEPAAEPAAPPRTTNPPPRNHWDFMGDTSEEKREESWDIPLPPEPQSPPQAGGEPADEPRQEQGAAQSASGDATGTAGETAEPARAERAETPRARTAAAFSHPRQWRGAARMPKLRRSHVLLGLAVLGGLILAILAMVALAGGFSAPSGLKSELSGLEGPIPAGPNETAFVTASLLSCRAAPARQARRVKNLARGDRVRVLAHDGEWISLSHRGRQCWAMRRYTSAERPL